MKDRVVRAVFAAVVVACECGSAWADIPASAYVQDGLIAQFDGIENTGAGSHDPNATMWKNLKGDDDLSFVDSVTVGDDCMTIARGTTMGYLSGNSAAFQQALTSRKFTAELSVKTDASYKKDGYAAYLHFGAAGNRRWLLLDIGEQNTYTFGRLQYRATAWDNSFTIPTANNYSERVTATLVEAGDGVRLLANGVELHKVAGKNVAPTTDDFLVGRYGGNKSLPGDYQSLRLYNRALTADEIAWNAKVDRARFEGDPSGYVCDVEKRSIKTRVRLQAKYGTEMSFDGETWDTSLEDWVEMGSPVTVQLRVPEGKVFSWGTLPTGAELSDDKKTLTFTAGVPVEVVAQVGETVTWNHAPGDTATCYWDDATRWNCSDGTHRVPGAYDNVVIPDRGSTPYGAYTIIATNPFPRFGSFYLGAKRTLSLRNGWDSKIEADTVVINGAKPGKDYVDNYPGVLSCAGGFAESEMSNRVWIVADELVLSNEWAKISASGYVTRNGEAWHGETGMASNDCGSHGGKGTTAHSHTYGSITEPTAPGSGPWRSDEKYKQNGGGAVRILVKRVVNNGSINATGTGGSFGWGGGAGSGGSIYISCDTIEGTGSVNANGGGNTSSSANGAGGGGRVAVHYDTAKQAAVDCQVAFAARGGCNLASSGARYTVGYSGTLYFPDDLFLKRPGRKLAGWVYYGPDVTLANSLVGENLALTNSLVELTTGAVVNVTGNLSFDGTNTRVNGLRTSDVDVPITVGGNLTLTGARIQVMKGSTIKVGGDLVVSEGSTVNNCGELYVKSAATNGTEAAGYVNSITVGGEWKIGKNALASIVCDPATGSIIPLATKTFTLDEGGALSANAGGWTNTKAPGYCGGYGGSHAGLGAASNGGYPKKKDGSLDDKYLYGNVKRPLFPGSGGNGNSTYLAGGGVIWLKTQGKMCVNGTISANGSNNGGWTSAGAGGSVYLQCDKLAGSTNGVITAKGGSSTVTYGNGAGGGGRVALWYRRSEFGDVNPTNVFTVSAAGGAGLVAVESDKKDGLPGSIYVHQIPGLRVFVR